MPSKKLTIPVSSNYSAPTTTSPLLSISPSMMADPWRSWLADPRILARTASRARAGGSCLRSVASRASTEGRMHSTIERIFRD